MTSTDQKALSLVVIVACFALAWWFTDWPPPPSGTTSWLRLAL